MSLFSNNFFRNIYDYGISFFIWKKNKNNNFEKEEINPLIKNKYI